MQFGNLAGLINGTEQVIYDSGDLGAAASSLATGSILNGDADGWYLVIVRHVSGATSTTVYLQPNGDSTSSHYGRKGIYCSGASAADNSTAGTEAGYNVGYGPTTGDVSFTVIRIYAKSGTVRMAYALGTWGQAGSTVTSVFPYGLVWTDTAANITSFTLYSNQTNGIGVGTRLLVLRPTAFTGGTSTGAITTPYIKGSWVRVGSQIVSGSAASSITFSGLNGNTDVLYYLHVAYKAAGSEAHGIRLNSDSGDNYKGQYVYASNTSVAAAQVTTGWNRMYLRNNGATTGHYGTHNMMLFAKSGYVRSAHLTGPQDITGTTITEINLMGDMWTNTADNITSVALVDNAANMDIGTQFELYALRPNG